MLIGNQLHFHSIQPQTRFIEAMVEMADSSLELHPPGAKDSRYPEIWDSL